MRRSTVELRAESTGGQSLGMVMKAHPMALMAMLDTYHGMPYSPVPCTESICGICSCTVWNTFVKPPV